MYVGDNTDPEEFVTYPRGKQLPDTGTLDMVLLGGIVMGTLVLFSYVSVKKKRLS